MVDAIPGMLVATSASGEVEYVNQPTLDAIGATLDSFKDFGWMSIIHPDDAEALKAKWITSVTTALPLDAEYRQLCASGAYRRWHIRCKPMRDETGAVIRWYGTINDIEERKKMEDDLRAIRDRLAQASKLAAIGELSASIAHEINQPLSAVVSNGDACIRWLSASPPNVERARLSAEVIVRDANSAAAVVRRIRALFEHTASDKISLDANEVIREVLQLMQGEFISKGIHVSTELGSHIPSVFADRVHVQQILINLVQNGIDAMDEIQDRPKTLLLRSHIQDAQFVAIQVKDSGTGIPDPLAIFEPFYTTKEKGLGVGLSICRSIVEAHAGRLWASADQAGGSTFEFTLPVDAMAIS